MVRGFKKLTWLENWLINVLHKVLSKPSLVPSLFQFSMFHAEKQKSLGDNVTQSMAWVQECCG